MALRLGRGAGPFRDRREAGRLLAERVAELPVRPTLVVGLARGGVEVAAEVSRAMRLPLDALAVRKVRHPWQPEYAIGAVTPGGGIHLRPGLDLERAQIQQAVATAVSEAELLDRRLHAGRASLDPAGGDCLLVDDGLATGATMAAAVEWARARGAARVTVAVPVGAPQTVAALERMADVVVCLEQPDELFAVGAWYVDFSQVPDERVVALLAETGGGAGVRVVEATLAAGAVALPADLVVPADARGAVLFAHGSGSGRRSPRNRRVAQRLNDAGLATVLLDLLTPAEADDRRLVFDIELLSHRLSAAAEWLRGRSECHGLPIGYFGASTGAAAALRAAAGDEQLGAIVSRGGRPDLAGSDLGLVRAPTLLIVGGADDVVLQLNREALARLTCAKQLVVVPGATHLFEEPGALDAVADHAAAWFGLHLPHD